MILCRMEGAVRELGGLGRRVRHSLSVHTMFRRQLRQRLFLADRIRRDLCLELWRLRLPLRHFGPSLSSCPP